MKKSILIGLVIILSGCASGGGSRRSSRFSEFLKAAGNGMQQAGQAKQQPEINCTSDRLGKTVYTKCR